MAREQSMNLKEYIDLCDNSNDLMQSVTPDGHFRYVNEAWLKTLGYKKNEITDLTIFDIIHTNELEHCQELFMKVLSGENVGLVTTAFTIRTGQIIFVEGNVNCHFVNGKPAYTRAIFRDITERKKAEEEREKLIQELKEALSQIKTLSGLTPICAWCKKIRDNEGYWASVEQYIEAHSEAEFTHGICPECTAKCFPNDK
ncbi:PAS domain S-box protein [Chloroflexota bacterium]